MSIHLDHDTLGQNVLRPAPAASQSGQPGTALAVPPRRGFWSVLGRIGRALGGGLKVSVLLTLFLLLGAIALERIGPVPWKPSSMLGTYGGNLEASKLLTEIEAKRAMVAAEQQEIARAQQATIVIQANNERVTKAYEALYQRGNILAERWANAAVHALQVDAENRIRALGGRRSNSNFKDGLAMWADFADLLGAQTGGLGDRLRDSAREDRQSMTREIIANYQAQSKQVVDMLNDWSAKVPDPAKVIAFKAKVDELYPVPPAPAPPAPIYAPGRAKAGA